MDINKECLANEHKSRFSPSRPSNIYIKRLSALKTCEPTTERRILGDLKKAFPYWNKQLIS